MKTKNLTKISIMLLVVMLAVAIAILVMNLIFTTDEREVKTQATEASQETEEKQD